MLADAFDKAAVVQAVKRAQPGVVIHQLTALAGVKDYKHFDKEFALTNRLRSEGTDNLLEAARGLVRGVSSPRVTRAGTTSAAAPLRRGRRIRLTRRRRSGAGVWSFIHVDDAASATIAAIERGLPGIYNIVDDEPAPVAVWLPELASALGAKQPRHVPLLLGRLVIGEVGVSMMTQIRGASNAKAKRELAWHPR